MRKKDDRKRIRLSQTVVRKRSQLGFENMEGSAPDSGVIDFDLG